MNRGSRRAIGTLGVTMAALAWVACGGVPRVSHETRIPAGVPHTAKPFRDAPEDFQFAIVADRTGGHRTGVFARAMEKVERLQPDFVVSVGDLIEGYSEDPSVLAAEWDEVDRLVDALDMPFFFTVGNHDVGNTTMLETWRERLGRNYWAFVYQGVLFVSLDTEDPPVELPPDIIERMVRFERLMSEDPAAVERMIAERGGKGPPKELPTQIAISEEQVDFVAETLAANPNVRWTFLLMHKPARAHESPGFERIEALLGDRPFTAIAGHAHYYDHTSRRGRDYVTLGTTGGVWLSHGPGSFDHVMWVSMTGEGPLLTPIRLDGLLELGGPEEPPRARTGAAEGEERSPAQHGAPAP